MELHDSNITDLIFKHLTNDLTVEEEKELNRWLEYPYNRLQFYKLTDKNSLAEKILLLQKCDSNKAWRELNRKTTLKVRMKAWMSYAAVILPIVLVASAVLCFSLIGVDRYKNESIADFTIDSESATLILHDGKEVDIINKDTSIVTNHTNINVKGQKISYVSDHPQKSNDLKFNILNIPRGLQYYLTLSDSTKVWLNADTQFRYPIAFAGDTREVFIESGEAYFEVSKNEKKPFIVHFNGRSVKVLGTRFNVKAYKEEGYDFVTLAEGSVVVKNMVNQVTLIPNQQALIKDHKLEINMVNANLFSAWKDKVFKYKGEKLEVIMNDLARFYDFKLFYRNQNAKEEKFSLKIKHDESFTTILEYIELTNKVKFEISGKNIIIQ